MADTKEKSNSPLIDKLFSEEEIQEMLSLASMNLLGSNYTSPIGQVEMKLYKTLKGFVTEEAYTALKEPVDPARFTGDWKQKFAQQVENVLLKYDLKKKCSEDMPNKIRELFGDSVGNRADTTFTYARLATFAGQFATMLYFGRDPKELLIE